MNPSVLDRWAPTPIALANYTRPVTISGKTVTYDFIDERINPVASESKNRIWQYVATQETDGKVKVLDSGFLIADELADAIAQVGQLWPTAMDLKVKVKEF